MKATATYQGITKEEIQAKIIYCENVLKNNELEVWEAKEYNSLIKEYKEQIAEIEENQAILNEIA
jgi:DNA-binding transcriptional regulator/RsmH inhibitor MraZ